jgi:Holliday junction resolvase RusA-like endonuclease
MPLKLRLEVPFVPTPKARPRVGEHGTVMPAAYKTSRQDLAWLLVDARNRLGPWPMDKSYVVTYEVWLYRRDGGDADNLVGTLLDAGNGLLWRDDRQVTGLHVKRYRGAPKVLIEVEVLEEPTGFEPPTPSTSGRYKAVSPKK